MNVFAMVTTRHSDVYTQYALESFFATTMLSGEDQFLLIDNDQTFDAKRLEQFSSVEHVLRENPRSFAANANAALARAREGNADLYFLNNDLIFFKHWLPPLTESDRAIVLPVSNAEFPYRADGVALAPAMDLDAYLGKEAIFSQIAAHHQSAQQGFRAFYGPPYYCVRIPHSVYDEVGDLDETFGPGGAEDMDYSIRTLLAGFSIGYALGSYVLHFQGKSTWRGAETEQETKLRNEKYVQAFIAKWGEPLTRLFIYRDMAVLGENASLKQAMGRGEYATVIKALRDG